MRPIVSAAELMRRLQSASRPKVFDATWLATKLPERAASLPDDAHLTGLLETQSSELSEAIPGAQHLDVQTHLSVPAGDDHPGVLFFTRETDASRLAASLGALGIASAHDHIVLYHRNRAAYADCDPQGLMGATRAWWTLVSWGFTSVQVLDGGFAAWKAAGGEVVAGAAPAAPVAFDSSTLADTGLKASAGDVRAATADGSGVQLMDTLMSWPNTAQKCEPSNGLVCHRHSHSAIV